MTRTFLRLHAPGPVFGANKDCKLELIEVGEDGNEVVIADLAKFVTAAEIPYVKVGSLTVLRADLICASATIDADVAEILTRTFAPKRRIRNWLRSLVDMTWRVRRWEHVEVTTATSRERRYKNAA